MKVRKRKHFFTQCKKAFILDMSDFPGLTKRAGGSFFIFHNGIDGERRMLDISEKHIGVRKTERGAKAFLKRVLDGKTPIKYTKYPS